ncbi:hypothetical protein KAJ89_00870 [Candidatus Parcubacteria bacterium]|nr:hypothetical protein [Candidatus Parcubacteria bacterium]
MQYIIGILILAVGFLIIFKAEWMLSNFGRIEFFENKLGTSGGSRLGYKLVGIVFIFFGFLAVTGMINGFMEWMLWPLTRYMVPGEGAGMEL